MNVGEWKDWCEMHERNANPQSPTPVAVDDAELRHRLRMIVSHASGGALHESESLDWSVNDICVAISRHRAAIWEQAQKSAIEALHRPLADEGMGELVKQYREGAHIIRRTEARWLNPQVIADKYIEAADAIQSLLSRCGEMEEALRHIKAKSVQDQWPSICLSEIHEISKAALNLKPGGLSDG